MLALVPQLNSGGVLWRDAYRKRDFLVQIASDTKLRNRGSRGFPTLFVGTTASRNDAKVDYAAWIQAPEITVFIACKIVSGEGGTSDRLIVVGNNNIIIVFDVTNNHLTGAYTGGTINTPNGSGPALNEWFTMCYSISPSQPSQLLALNGDVKATGSSSTAITYGSSEVTIGNAENTSALTCSGEYEIILLFNKALNASEIRALHNDWALGYQELFARRPITYFIPAAAATRRIFVVS